MREIVRGLVAAGSALLAMAGVAAVGLALLGAAGLTAPMVALAVGGSVDFQAAAVAGLPVGLRGELHGIPLGVSVAGAVVLGWLLLRRREGLLLRGAVAGAAFVGVLGGIALWARERWGCRAGSADPRAVFRLGCRVPVLRRGFRWAALAPVIRRTPARPAPVG
ncbi:hypothetical protein SAMN05421837_101232 [Amycolatopsis pretoriensis]|uniref:Uncharacterized protein n=3 Tax=Amycolatopsis pretoriensis TaxID=218821 RepID=A0A1H5Q3X3_9PSEU|nr:hypothetical protein SAMN05421837_101232 [Amycolatopsis pretoriensis]